MTGNNPDHGIPVQGTEHHLLRQEVIGSARAIGLSRLDSDVPGALIIDAQYYMTRALPDDQDAIHLAVCRSRGRMPH